MAPGPVQRVDLPDGPGVYLTDTWYRNREATAAYVRDVWRDTTDPAVRRRRLDDANGREEYLVRLWQLTHQPPVDELDD